MQEIGLAAEALVFCDDAEIEAAELLDFYLWFWPSIIQPLSHSPYATDLYGTNTGLQPVLNIRLSRKNWQNLLSLDI